MTNQCEHGSLARQCQQCEDAATIAELRAEVDRLGAKVSDMRAEAERLKEKYKTDVDTGVVLGVPITDISAFLCEMREGIGPSAESVLRGWHQLMADSKRAGIERAKLRAELAEATRVSMANGATVITLRAEVERLTVWQTRIVNAVSKVVTAGDTQNWGRNAADIVEEDWADAEKLRVEEEGAR